MLSLSDNEFSVINFLVRNYTEKLTIRNIAQKLKFSPAGVFNILKKLEKNGIMTGQKLGTGLFYSINFESSIARHLCAVVLVYPSEKTNVDLQMFKDAKCAILSKKSLLIVQNIAAHETSIQNYDILAKTEDEIIELLRKRDEKILEFLRHGTVMFGEDKAIEMIRKATSW